MLGKGIAELVAGERGSRVRDGEKGSRVGDGEKGCGKQCRGGFVAFRAVATRSRVSLPAYADCASVVVAMVVVWRIAYSTRARFYPMGWAWVRA